MAGVPARATSFDRVAAATPPAGAPRVYARVRATGRAVWSRFDRRRHQRLGRPARDQRHRDRRGDPPAELCSAAVQGPATSFWSPARWAGASAVAGICDPSPGSTEALAVQVLPNSTP